MNMSLKDLYRLSMRLPPEDRRRLAEFLLNPPRIRTADQILTLLGTHAEVLRNMRVQRIGLFGSVARGEADPASDIDILVKLSQFSF